MKRLLLLLCLPLYSADYLTVAYGPMCSGKSAFLLRVIDHCKRNKIPHVVFTHTKAINKKNHIVSRNTSYMPYPAHAVESAFDLYEIARHFAMLQPYIRIFVDEAQFFDKKEMPNLVTACHWLNMNHKQAQIVVAGLDMDFTGHDFNCIPELARKALQNVPLVANCAVCNEPALLTQRLVNREPARKTDPIVMPEGLDKQVTYEPRCLLHWIKPD